MVLSRIVAAAMLCLVPAATVMAQARIEDCESIQAADAYNQCLAKFGPTSKVKSVEPVKPSDIKDNSAEAAAGAKAAASAKASAKVSRHASRGHGVRARGRHVATRGRHGGSSRTKKSGGRKRMTIVVHRRK